MQPIGSDFETADSEWITGVGSQPPWNDGRSDWVYVESGRQALSLIARSLVERGVTKVAVPEYLCASMLDPLRELPTLAITAYPLNDAFDVHFEEVERQVRGPDWAVLFASYFGQSPSRDRKQLVSMLRDVGTIVIEDETHRVFAPGGVPAHYRFASLRKLLPVGDGAYVTGLSDEVGLLGVPVSDSRRWEAMDLKADVRRFGGDERPHKDLFATENARLEEQGRIRLATSRTREELARLDYNGLADRRVRNASVLRHAVAELGGVRLVHASPGSPDSHVVISVDRPRELQRYLAQERIYCPIHWPEPRNWGAPDWRNDVISLPVDHRYARQDMERVVDSIRRWLKS